MEDLSTFLELPLDRGLYSPKLKIRDKQPPLTVLITEANTKIAKYLMYKICLGEVFGPDQKVFLHLTYSTGKKDMESITSDLYSSGSSVILGIISDGDPEKMYKNVDLVVAITAFEEFSEVLSQGAVCSQMFFVLEIAENMAKYAKKSSKLVICGPSTKGSIILLTTLKRANFKIRHENVSGVTILDETITKNLIAAKLKTTTNNIRNIVIWGATHADIRNGTVFTYPPEDKRQYKKVHIPLLEALQDDHWIQSDLLNSIHRRIVSSCLVTGGAAVAAATATHLRLLFQGSNVREETFSMGVIISSDEPYGLNPMIGFSLPVTTKNASVTVKEDVPLEVYSYLMNLKDEFNLTVNSQSSSFKMLKLSLSKSRKKDNIRKVEEYFREGLKNQRLKLKYVLCSLPRSENFKSLDQQWEDLVSEEPNDSSNHKRMLKFVEPN